MHLRRSFASLLVTVVVAVMLAPGASADTISIDDATGDVTGQNSHDTIAQPGADIVGVDVDHQPRNLEVRISVAQLVPFDDPAWSSGQIAVTALMNEKPGPVTNDFDADIIWNLIADGAGGASGDMFSNDGSIACTTEASLDEDAKQYILSAGPDCMTFLPRSLAFRATITYDPTFNPDTFNPDTFDPPIDYAPDNGFSALVAASGEVTVTRIAGTDRIATAIALSFDRFGDGGAVSAVLVSSEGYADAIAAGPLATAFGGPVLLTGTAGLDQRVADELVRVLPPGSNVFLLGGTAALSPAVVSGVTKAGFHARRLSGANRFETAVAVADQVAHDLVIIADGRGFREALIASAAAASLGGVVVLTDGATLPAATDDFLAHDASRHLAIGLAAQAATGTERITAANPADLSVKVINRLLPGVRTLGVASQGTYADALAAAPYLAARHGGLLLTDGTSLSAEIGAELTHRAAATREVILLGGTGAISASTQAQIAEALSSSS